MDISGVNWRKSSYSTSNSNCVEVALTWRKSSYSSSDGACVEVGLTWRKSSYSGSNGGGCVEVAQDLPEAVAVRDSKDPQGPVLTFGPAAWQSFLGQIKSGDLTPG